MTNPNIVKPEDKAFMKALVFAPHGRGKTTFLGTAQEDERTAPLLLLDFEGNTESLYGLDVDIWPVRNWDNFEEVYRFLSVPGHGYKSIGIDSISEVNTYALLQEMTRRVNIGGPGREDFPDQAQKQDYGAILVQMRRLLRRFRDLPMHVIYTALDDTEPEPGEGIVKIPGMVGKMRREVGALMSVVGYIALDPEKKDDHGEPLRTLLLRDIPAFRVKVRTAWKMTHTVPQRLDDPTVGKLMNVVFPKMKIDG
jgi:hypothetical protein